MGSDTLTELFTLMTSINLFYRHK